MIKYKDEDVKRFKNIADTVADKNELLLHCLFYLSSQGGPNWLIDRLEKHLGTKFIKFVRKDDTFETTSENGDTFTIKTKG